MDQWMQQARPYIEAFERESARWLNAPTFGLAREHQERWQALALAQQEYQRHSNEFNALMLKTAEGAFKHFETLLGQHAGPGKQITSARGLFDLWIDAAEQSYAEIAMTDEFRHVYGAMTNAQMRVRLAVQRETEQLCGLLGVPTRTEVDAAHRKIVELERMLRRQTRAASDGAASAPSPRAAPANTPRPRSKPAATKPVAKATARPRRASAKAAPTKVATVRTTAQKAPAKKSAKAAATAAKPATRRGSSTSKRAAAVAKAATGNAVRSVAKPRSTRAAAAGKSKSDSAKSARKPAKASSVKDWVARNQFVKPAAKRTSRAVKAGRGARR